MLWEGHRLSLNTSSPICSSNNWRQLVLITCTRLSHSLSSQGHIFSTSLKAWRSAPVSTSFLVISSQLWSQTAIGHWRLPLLCWGHLIPARNASSVLALQLGLFLLPLLGQTLGHLVLSAPYPVPRALSWTSSMIRPKTVSLKLMPLNGKQLVIWF